MNSRMSWEIWQRGGCNNMQVEEKKNTFMGFRAVVDGRVI